MKLWLLRPIGFEGHHWESPDKGSPWQVWYDTMAGFVVRAETELQARELAAEVAGEEQFADRARNIRRIPNPWIESDLVSCTELMAEGAPGVLIGHHQDA